MLFKYWGVIFYVFIIIWGIITHVLNTSDDIVGFGVLFLATIFMIGLPILKDR